MKEEPAGFDFEKGGFIMGDCDVGFFSRLREINLDSSFSVTG